MVASRSLKPILRAGFALAVLAVAAPVLADPGADFNDVVVPMPPEADVAAVAPPAAGMHAAAELLAPVPASAEPAILPPDLPDAGVTITVAEQMASAIEARLADPRLLTDARLPKREREGIAAFYALGAFQPILIGEGGLTPAGRGVAGRLAAAAEDALDPRAYALPAIPGQGATAAALADAELRLAALAVLYARDARGARIDPAKLSRLITPKLDLPAADAVLTHLATSGPGAGVALQAYNPHHAGYRLLRARLADLRSRKPAADAPVADGPASSPGGEPRVPLIRSRVGLGSDAAGATALDTHASAGADLQGDRRAPPSRVSASGSAALAARPSRPSALEADVIANMERWRWLPADLGGRYVAVNIPEFRGRVIEGGRTAHDMRVIVGKSDSPTPVFSGTMTYAVVNPSWNIPPSILKNEILPGLARDPYYAAKRGYEVVRRGNSISVRQPPGERNALGFIKFMFPNDHAVYLHDTPNRSLFSATKRAFSHGCVRVDQPFQLAEELLGNPWPEPRLRALIGKGERTITLAQPLPVHLTYFTLVADGGTLRSVDDLYGYNARVKAALGLTGS